jgi:hypothetical protein
MPAQEVLPSPTTEPSDSLVRRRSSTRRGVCFAPILAQQGRGPPPQRARATFTDAHGLPQPAPAPRFSRTTPRTRARRLSRVRTTAPSWPTAASGLRRSTSCSPPERCTSVSNGPLPDQPVRSDRNRGETMALHQDTAGESTHERVLRVAAETFARKGYHATGVAELGAAAGLQRGALHYQIKSKEGPADHCRAVRRGDGRDPRNAGPDRNPRETADAAGRIREPIRRSVTGGRETRPRAASGPPCATPRTPAG